MTAGQGPSRAAYGLYALVGVAAWMGTTIYVGASSDDPADTGSTRTAFIIGGALFTVGLLSLHLWGQRAAGRRTSDALYDKLVITPVSGTDQGAARRHTTQAGYVFLLAATVTAALTLAAIGLGPGGPSRALAYTAIGVVAVTGVYLMRALGVAYKAGGEWIRPLGLSVTAKPAWIPHPGPMSGGIVLAGDVVFSGRRHGREVAIFQDAHSALTAIQGSFQERTIDDPDELAALTGQAGPWRDVQVESGPDGLTVVRRGSGAGAYMLQDLWLAECVAGRPSG